MAEFPTTLDFLLDYGSGGVTWVGTFGPTAAWPEGTRRGFEILDEMGYPPVLVTRPMRGGHYAVLRFIMPFDRESAEEVKKVGECNRRLAEMALDVGFIPYKPPAWAAEMILERADPGMKLLMKKIKKTLDPKGIMNPGRWGF